jgi:hypothetical protein
MLHRAGIFMVACALFAAHGAGQSADLHPNAQSPRVGGPDLPQRDIFLRETRDALTRSQELWHRYTYRQRRTELHLNPFGRMGTGGSRLTEVRPSADPRFTYRRVIERDGAPVSQADLDRQDAEYRARVARLKREIAVEDADDEERRQQDELLARRRAQMMIDDVANTLRFDLVRREIRDGRPTIVVSFARRPEARPSTREGRLASVFAGHLWVDEATRELMQFEGVAGDDVSFGGFVAKVYEGTKAVVVRQEIETGVWMPTRLTLSGDVRALFRRAKIDHLVEWFDYRRVP